MMKKAFIFFFVLVLSVGIFAVPTGAEGTEEEEAETETEAEKEQRLATQKMSELMESINTNIQMSVEQLKLGKMTDELKESLTSAAWELYKDGSIPKGVYQNLFIFLQGSDYHSDRALNDKNHGILGIFYDPVYPYERFMELYNNRATLSDTSDIIELIMWNTYYGFSSVSEYKKLPKDSDGNLNIPKSAFKDALILVSYQFRDIDDDEKDTSEFERQEAVTDGGREFADELLDDRINKMYKVMYPFGIAIMLVCWMIGMTRSGLNATFDIKDKDSIARSMIDLVIGIGLLALAPWIIETMTSLGFEMCDRIGVAWRPEIYEKNDDGAVRWVIDALGIDTVKDKLLLALIKGTLVMNIMRIGLMQCLAPLSIGCIAGGDRTKNMAFGWLKEYLKLCLLPAVTAIYICLACAATHTIDSMWINIIIGLSYFVVPKMMLDKLFG